jgi:hypothetical protein
MRAEFYMGEFLLAVIAMFVRRVDWLVILTVAASIYLTALVYVMPEYVQAFQQDDRPWPAALWAQVSEIASNTIGVLVLLAFWMLVGLVAVGVLIGLLAAPITTLLALTFLTLVCILFW